MAAHRGPGGDDEAKAATSEHSINVLPVGLLLSSHALLQLCDWCTPPDLNIALHHQKVTAISHKKANDGNSIELERRPRIIPPVPTELEEGTRAVWRRSVSILRISNLPWSRRSVAQSRCHLTCNPWRFQRRSCSSMEVLLV